MRPLLAALLLSGILVTAGAAVSMVGSATHSPADSDGYVAASSHHEGMSGHAHGSHGGGAHAWKGGTGKIPAMTDALTTLERRQSIVIGEDSAFNPANGVRSGSGTYDDPWVISGWFVDVVLIKDTTAAFEFKENYVNDILILDWTGQGGYVHHNLVSNLRTNRNVERVGAASATVIEHNEIHRIQELRHFDGLVRNNTIGKEDLLPLLANGVALNIAGLNGAGIHDNVIRGGVDMKIHGHHHSDRPGISSHNHGKADETQNESHVEDHQVRYIDFLFYNNHIVDDKFGMRYNDLNHAGDDRTATSEEEPDLELPHIHHTRVTIRHNVIDGATLRVATLNAQDERHLPGETATIEIAHNKILAPTAGDGIVVQDVRNAEVLIHDNVVERGQLQIMATSAVYLLRFSNTTVTVDKNSFGDYDFGVRAREFDNTTRWVVAANRGADEPVYWDNSVAHPPMGAPDEHAGHEHGHSHGGGAATPAGNARSVIPAAERAWGLVSPS